MKCFRPFELRTFESFEELMTEVRAGREEADAAVGYNDSVFVPGVYFVRFAPELDLIIYGEVLDPVESEKRAGADEDELRFTRELYEAPHMKYVRFTNCYSEIVPDGEFGNTHVAFMHAKLRSAEFERARQAGWPSDRRFFEIVLNAKLTSTEVAEA